MRTESTNSASGGPQGAPNVFSRAAVFSAVMAVMGLFVGITLVPAIVAGHVALGRIRRAGGALRGHKVAQFGLLLGYLGLLPWLTLLVFPSTIPNLIRAQAEQVTLERVLECASDYAASNNGNMAGTIEELLGYCSSDLRSAVDPTKFKIVFSGKLIDAPAETVVIEGPIRGGKLLVGRANSKAEWVKR